MVTFKDGCVDCGLPCLGNLCPHKREACLICDCCKIETDRLFECGDEQLCADCLTDAIPLVNQDEYEYDVTCDMCGCADEELYDYENGERVLCEYCLLKITELTNYEED